MLHRHGPLSAIPRARYVLRVPRNRLAWASSIRKVTKPQNDAPTSPRATAQVTKRIRPEDHQEPLPYRQPGRPQLPERVLIYHAGAARTTCIALVKATNLLFFAGCCAYGFQTGAQALSPASAVTLASLAWTATCAYVTAPFVVAVHLRAPIVVRASKETLLRWSRSFPQDAMLDIRTLRLHGGAKTSGVRVGELRALEKRWWRIANLQKVEVDRRGAPLEQRKTTWWRPWVDWTAEPRNKFLIEAEGRAKGRGSVPGVLENLWLQIKRQPHHK